MPVGDEGFPRLVEQDLPSGASPALKRQLHSLYRMVMQVRVVANSHFLFVELARRKQFTEAISQTPAAAGTRFVVTALVRDMVIGIASLFDQNTEATDLRRVLNEILKDDNRDVFAAFHEGFHGDFDAVARRERLQELRSLINRKPYKPALERVVDLRRQAVAHIDLEPDFARGRPLVRDLGLLLAYAAVTARDASLFGLGHPHDLQQAKQNYRRYAAGFADTLLRGASAWRAGMRSLND